VGRWHVELAPLQGIRVPRDSDRRFTTAPKARSFPRRPDQNPPNRGLNKATGGTAEEEASERG
jgi:hypothetical protein